MTLRQNRDYASVVAPFNGVTQRNVDVGSLVEGNANTGTFMFEIMQRDVIGVFVYVPQDAAFSVAPGVDAIVREPEIPNREFPGKVTRIADALQRRYTHALDRNRHSQSGRRAAARGLLHR
jgi:multidrug efflux pump subunit AcrA (membrane-fusion protein)